MRAAAALLLLSPVLVGAFEAYVTLGEVCTVLREEWSEHREALTI